MGRNTLGNAALDKAFRDALERKPELTNRQIRACADALRIQPAGTVRTMEPDMLVKQVMETVLDSSTRAVDHQLGQRGPRHSYG